MNIAVDVHVSADNPGQTAFPRLVPAKFMFNIHEESSSAAAGISISSLSIPKRSS